MGDIFKGSDQKKEIESYHQKTLMNKLKSFLECLHTEELLLERLNPL